MGAFYLARSEAPELSEYKVLMTVNLDKIPHKICIRMPAKD